MPNGLRQERQAMREQCTRALRPERADRLCAGTDKLDVKPSGKVLAALRKGRTLTIRVTLIFIPAETTDHITAVTTETVHLKLKTHSRKQRR